MKTLQHLFTLALALLLSTNAAAQPQLATEKTFGDITLYYTVVNTTFVDPEVAARYQLVRAKDRAFLNLAFRRNLPEGGDVAVTALIEGRSWDFFQNAFLEFREIREREAIYYIAEFDFNDEEIRFFDLRFAADGAQFSTPFRFQQKLHEN